MDEQKIIFFQEIDDDDRALAVYYGYDFIGSRSNIGIAGAFKELVEAATGDLFLFLENDWELLNPDPGPQLYDAAEILRHYVIHVARFRHVAIPGNPVWSRQFAGRGLDRPEYLLESVFWHNDDPKKYMPYLWYLTSDTEWWTASPKYASWTNNPFMARTKWLKETLIPNIGTGDIEIQIRDWWKEQHFTVAQSTQGLFTHNRLDR